MKFRNPTSKNDLANEEIKFLQNPKALRNKAIEVLKKAKALEAAKIASGATWQKKGNRTLILKTHKKR